MISLILLVMSINTNTIFRYRRLKIEVFKKNLNNNNCTIHNNQSIYTVNRYNHTTTRQYNKQRHRQYAVWYTI